MDLVAEPHLIVQPSADAADDAVHDAVAAAIQQRVDAVALEISALAPRMTHLQRVQLSAVLRSESNGSGELVDSPAVPM